jgi:hypothetical protein
MNEAMVPNPVVARASEAVWRDAGVDVAEGERLAVGNFNFTKGISGKEAAAGGKSTDQADAVEAPGVLDPDTYRGTDGKAAVGADAAPGNDAGGMFLSDTGDAPKGGAGGKPALAEAEDEPAEEDGGEAGQRPGAEKAACEEAEAGNAGGDQAGEHGAAGTDGIGHASGLRAAEDGGDVLGADGEPGENGIEVELQVDDAGQDSHGQADGEVTEENLQGGGENPERDPAGSDGKEGTWSGRRHLLSLWYTAGCRDLIRARRIRWRGDGRGVQYQIRVRPRGLLIGRIFAISPVR